ncbi:hypothetical protein ACFORH_43070 [Amycolatopsis roodepoortensis]|uniref:Lsr2 family protein n=1 Tax=Amycolatopsis roodepoortensis TaxID=700274 RepID=A0ABR9LIS9_9PSEU|nr:hypothetical protein [Amycolatopsis roodepoortensis]MBE1580477.1 hypothetical protein [Amycolatopsis roodepoortensis]
MVNVDLDRATFRLARAEAARASLTIEAWIALAIDRFADVAHTPDTKPGARSAKAKPTAKSAGKPKMTKDDVLTWARQRPDPETLTPAPVLKHFKEQGYELVTDRAVRYWLADIRK